MGSLDFKGSIEVSWKSLKVEVVAGAGFEPTTFRL
jgi:hypothetical protein